MVWGIVFSSFYLPGWVPTCKLKYFCCVLQLSSTFIVMFIKTGWKLETICMFWLLLPAYILSDMNDCQVYVGPCAGKHSTSHPGWGMSSPVIWALWLCRLHGVGGFSGGKRCCMDFVARPSGRITIQDLGNWEPGHTICSRESCAFRKLLPPCYKALVETESLSVVTKWPWSETCHYELGQIKHIIKLGGPSSNPS